MLREAIGEGIDSRETVELKKEYLCGLENFLADKPPPLSLAGVAESTKSTQVNEGKKSKFIDVENIFVANSRSRGQSGNQVTKISYRSSVWRDKSSLELREVTRKAKLSNQ